MNIDEIRQSVNFIANKTQSGVVKTSQFNLAASMAQLEFFNKNYKEFQMTKQVTDALRVWLKSIPLLVNTSSGRTSFPEDFMRMSAVYRIFYNDNESSLVEVNEVNDDEIGSVLMSQIITPTLRYPKFCQYDTYMQFYPKKIGSIQFNYFRIPTTPVWNYTVVNGRQVYNPLTSVDLEVGVEYENEVIFMICSYLGMNLREGDLVKYSEMQKAQGV